MRPKQRGRPPPRNQSRRDLAGIGDKPATLLDFGQRHDLPRHLLDWLAAKVTAPRSFREGLKMPEFTFTEEELTAVVTALLSYTRGAVLEPYRVPATVAEYGPPGRFGALAREYRCQSCHQIQGAGEDLSTAPLTAEGSKVKGEWLKQYLPTCHGEEGRGDGFNAYNLEPKPRDLGDPAFQAQRLDEDLAALIRIGGGAAGLSTAMPPSGRVLNPRQIDQLVAYLRTLQPKEENEEPESDGGEVSSRSK